MHSVQTTPQLLLTLLVPGVILRGPGHPVLAAALHSAEHELLLPLRHPPGHSITIVLGRIYN